MANRIFRKAGTRAVLTAGLLLALAGTASAQKTIAGEEEYMRSCAACHGEKGRGDGPVAESMNLKLPDLSKIRENNKGTFPFGRIIQVIDGRADIAAHGSRQMPVWGARFSADVGPDYRPTDPEATQEIVRGRILELVNYLTAIQDPPVKDDILLP